MEQKCRICNSDMEVIFKANVLNKYDVAYHKCKGCGFIQTDSPFWLEESYSDAITSLDIGLVSRNIMFSDLIEKVLKRSFDYNAGFLDFAGGYGMFVRMMRDKGFDFYWCDKYCDNLYAKDFSDDMSDTSIKFEAITAFEVFEHLVDPMSEIENLFQYTDTIIFSTEQIPSEPIRSSHDWWYISPEIGQHISFYSKESFEFIARKFSCDFYSDGKILHILTKKKLKKNPETLFVRTFWDRIVDKCVSLLIKTKSNCTPVVLKSRLGSDYNMIRKRFS